MKNIELYRQMHKAAKQHTFAGMSAMPHAEALRELVAKTHSIFLLDYGSGKGWQYTRFKLHEQIGVPMPVLYDPGVLKLKHLPGGKFHGVICTDVLEHLEGEDLDEALTNIWDRAERFIFLAIATHPAKKFLPDGRNAHLTVQPREWWSEKIGSMMTGRSQPKLVRVVYTDGGVVEPVES